MKRPASLLSGVGVTAWALVVQAAAPAGRYTVASGTVYDTKTKLTWQQVVSGSYTQSAGAAYCAALSLNGTGWRLPTFKELLTIVDFSVASPGPTIDANAFPNTPSSAFWSSTAEAGGSGYYFIFEFGFAEGTADVSSSTYPVRCVR